MPKDEKKAVTMWMNPELIKKITRVKYNADLEFDIKTSRPEIIEVAIDYYIENKKIEEIADDLRKIKGELEHENM